tara:strand:+ start:269 stop:799 length:531 start_codon:yes stop_codon:yes gene_type:complete
MDKKSQNTSEAAVEWDKIAAEHGGYRRAVWPPVKEFLAKGAILDIGCGNGNYLRKKDVGIDISFEMCKLAKKHCFSICADATYLPVKSFPRVLSVATIHHLRNKKDRVRFLEEIKRVSKTALITAWRGSGNTYKKWGSATRFYHLFTKQELSKLASKVFDKYDVYISDKNLFLHVN